MIGWSSRSSPRFTSARSGTPLASRTSCTSSKCLPYILSLQPKMILYYESRVEGTSPRPSRSDSPRAGLRGPSSSSRRHFFTTSFLWFIWRFLTLIWCSIGRDVHRQELLEWGAGDDQVQRGAVLRVHVRSQGQLHQQGLVDSVSYYGDAMADDLYAFRSSEPIACRFTATRCASSWWTTSSWTRRSCRWTRNTTSKG